MEDKGYIVADWDKAEGVSTSEGFIKPLVATKNVSVTALEIAPGDEVLPHNHDGLPYFEVVLYVCRWKFGNHLPRQTCPN